MIYYFWFITFLNSNTRYSLGHDPQYNLVDFRWRTGMNDVHTGFEVLRVVVMKSSVFWDVMSCSPLKTNRRFGGTYLLSSSHLFPAWFILRTWRWRLHFPLKRQLTFNEFTALYSRQQNSLLMFIFNKQKKNPLFHPKWYFPNFSFWNLKRMTF
jgi:hypothetical protein